MYQHLETLWPHVKDRLCAIAYSTGLILAEQKPTFRLLQSTTGFRAVELSEFLQAEMLGWETDSLFDEVIRDLPAGGELITDEVVLPKENTSEMEASLVYSSSQKRLLQGQAYAVLVWAQGQTTRVVGFRAVYDDLFAVTEEMTRHFLSLGPAVTGLRADGAYFKPGCWKPLKALGLPLVSKPRRDTWWWYGNEEIQFIISTGLTLSTRQIILAYRGRWRIEVLFRDCKQHLGLKAHQGWKQSSLRHVAM